MDEQGHDLRERVQKALEELRPALQMDGGDAELVAVENGVVTVRLIGACEGCAMASDTLLGFVLQQLRLRVPEVREVVSA
jgi:Fe-S cluster biogenesis protein NfuA